MKKLTFTLVILSLITSCNVKNERIIINGGPVVIMGEIIDYKGINEVGRLTYFDAITRIPEIKNFPIDSTGKFSLKFKLAHPIIGSVFFDLEDKFYNDFYIEPNKSYRVRFVKNKIVFIGESGQLNQVLNAFYDSLNIALDPEFKRISSIRKNNLSLDQYTTEIEEMKNRKLEYLNHFCRIYKVKENIKSIIQNYIRFNAALSRLTYRNDNNLDLRDSIPIEFYTQIFNNYQILNYDEVENRNSIDYISNIVSVLSVLNNNVENRMEFIKSKNYFSPSELDLISKLYNNFDPEIRKTPECKKFFSNRDNYAMLKDLFYRYNFRSTIKNIDMLQPNLGRDLVVSQAFAKNFIEKSIPPDEYDWKIIDSIIINQSVQEYLEKLTTNESYRVVSTNTSELPEISLNKVKEKYINKYHGKVIYIDFYATWCGPCLAEIPYSEELQFAFEDKDVVFLNLCAKSSEENWNKLIRTRELKGENYLLSDSEYVIMSSLFDVKGFPSYAIVDKNGNIIKKNAPSPSSKKTVIYEINKLL